MSEITATRSLRPTKEAGIAAIALTAIATHLALRYGVRPAGTLLDVPWPDVPLIVALAAGGIPLVVELLMRVVRLQFGSDLLAGISIVTAAMLGEYLAGTLVVLMLSGGQTLETYAVRSASSALLALARRMPALAHRRTDGRVMDVPLESLVPGDCVVVFPHETCPVDGVVLDGHSTMDESYLTGEPYMLAKVPGASVLSGAINGEGALTIRAEKSAVDSRYAKIMQVMRESEQRRPRLRRLGDQLGAIYTPVAVAIAAAAWAMTRRPGPVPGRAGGGHAVPAAHRHSGRHHRIRVPRGSARHHHQGPGRARTDRHVPHGDLRQDRHAHLRPAEADRGAARAWVYRARRSGGDREPRALLAPSAGVGRDRGGPPQPARARGASGCVANVRAKVSEARSPDASCKSPAAARLLEELPATRALLPDVTGGLECVVILDGVYAATFRFRDEPRTDGRSFIGHLGPRHGFQRVMLVSGDRDSEVRYLAEKVGITEVYASQSPEQKLALVRAETRQTKTVFMGDGINDAPALTAATVGIAFGQGSDVTAEAAGVVIMDSSLGRVDELLHIGRRMRRVALQTAVGGMALSLVGIGVAAAGYLPPVAGAVTQEVIDVFAVLNALRTTVTPRVLSDFQG